MFETKFFIDGKRVSEKEARMHWKESDTYKNASYKTRDDIWRIAIRGDENGNHNPQGEITHLIEAGITLEA